MTTARAILETALTVHLNRLSPGETLNADDTAVCLRALNDVVDIINGEKTKLFRELLSPSAAPISGSSATLGTNWTAVSPGDEILGASYNDGAQDVPLRELTLAQYQALPNKTQAGDPEYWVHDGLATVYLYPAPSTARTVTLRTKQPVTEFTGIDADYSMPKGWRSGLAALTAEALAPVMLGGITPAIARAASAARSRLTSMALSPAIVDVGDTCEFDINTGWR